MVQNGTQQQPYKRLPIERTQSAPESNSVYHTRPEARNLKRFDSEKNDNNTDMPPNGREIVKRQVSSASQRMSVVSNEEDTDIHRQSPTTSSDIHRQSPTISSDIHRQSPTISDYRMLSRRTGTLPRQNTIDHSFERSVDAPYVIGQSTIAGNRNSVGGQTGLGLTLIKF